MKYISLSWFFLVLLLCSCSRQSKVFFDDQVLVEVEMVEKVSKLIKKDIDCIYPIKMARMDSLFIIQDLVGSNIVNVFNEQGEFLSCLIKKGPGPDEVSNVTAEFCLDRSKGIVSVYDRPYLKDYNVYKFMDGEKNFCVRVNYSSFNEKYPIKNAFRMNGSVLLVGFTKNMRYAVVRDDSITDVYKDYPLIIDVEQRDELIPAIISYSPCFGVAPDGESWVQGTYIGGVLESFKISNGMISAESKSFIYPPYYEANVSKAGVDVSWGNETTIGFEDIVITSDYIYTLLNGIKGENLKNIPPISPFTDKITVFDKQGNVAKIIKTDCMIMTFDIDEKENKCYAVVYNGAEGFDLREISIL